MKFEDLQLNEIYWFQFTKEGSYYIGQIIGKSQYNSNHHFVLVAFLESLEKFSWGSPSAIFGNIEDHYPWLGGWNSCRTDYNIQVSNSQIRQFHCRFIHIPQVKNIKCPDFLDLSEFGLFS